MTTNIHEFNISPPADAALINPSESEGWRVVCTPDQARQISAAVDSLGWIVNHTRRPDAMSFEEALDKLKALRIVALVTKPSPFNEDGSLTERAKDDIRSGAMTATSADGKLIDPDAAESTAV